MATATAVDKKGMKRICTSCSTRFYDFNKRPVICPNCKTEFTGEIKVKSRRGRAAANDIADEGQVSEKTAVAKGVADGEEEEVLIDGDDEVVSLDALEDDEDDDIDEEEEEIDPDLELDEDDLDDIDDDEDDDEDDGDDDDEEEEEEEDDASPKRKPKKKR